MCFDIISDILPGIYSDILSSILSCIYSDMLSRIYSGILSDILSRIFSDILLWMEEILHYFQGRTLETSCSQFNSV